MHFIGAIIIGLIVGLVARFLKPGRDPMGFILTAILGVVGSLIATFVGRWVGLYAPDEPAGFIASVVGAILVLAIYNRVGGRKGSTGILNDRDRRAA